MTKERRRANNFPALVFALFFSLSSIVTFAFSLETFRNAEEKKAGSSRIGLGILSGYGLFPGSQNSGGLAFGATFILAFSKNIAIELAGVYFKGSVESDPNTLSKGHLTTMPMQLSLLGRFPISTTLTPYVLAGGSYFLNSFNVDSTVEGGWNAVGITLTEKVDNAFGFHFGGGLEFALGEKLSADIELRYCIGKTKGSWSMKDDKSNIETSGTLSDLKLDTMILAVGLKYFFK